MTAPGSEDRFFILVMVIGGLVLGLSKLAYHLFLAKARVYIADGARMPVELPPYKEGEVCPATEFLKKLGSGPRRIALPLQGAVFLMSSQLYLMLFIPSMWFAVNFHRSFLQVRGFDLPDPISNLLLALLVISPDPPP